MTVYSHSRINTFENCPQQYKFRYLDKIERDFESIEAFMGKRFHEVMEFLYGEVPVALPTLQELLDLYEDQWQSHFHNEVTVVKKAKSIDDYRQIGRQCIENYFARYYPFDQSETLGLEHKVFFPLDPDNRFQLIGFIDRLARKSDGVYEIHDYKTSASLPPANSFEKDRQLGLYQIAVEKSFPDAREVRLIWHYVALNEEVTSSRSSEHLQTLRQETISAILAIEQANAFPPKESRLCDWCAYQDLCPAKQGRSTVVTMATHPETDEARLVDEISALAIKKQKVQSEIKELDRQLKDLMQQAEAVASQKCTSLLSGSTHSLKIAIDKKMTLHPNKGVVR